MTRTRRRSRGQALTELAICLPVLAFMLLGIVDLARGFYLSIGMSGAARSGARAGIQGDGWDIGDYVRSEPANSIPDNAATWGSEAAGGSNGVCTGAASSQRCGDPNGCSLTGSSWTSTQLACFAIRTCTLTGGDTGTCTSYGAWGSRPTSASAKGLEVLVVYRFAPLTPLMSQFIQATYLGLNQSATGDALYV